ncbi:hypothetical protein BXZ70DRAFT_225682 [Cristinia sonorae]|uniref:Uncharacterized protein n=1 Tax=Cristinia sonorae TaxID=1940300 RepID=A0A8K0XPA8_9AGAR|nr:hypothetical protein BXZ70DRAFT_225682 [Cristinia sonorae]
MVDWMSPEEIAKDAAVFLKMQHCLAGIFFWEFVISLDFEWDFITGKKKLNWPMIPYFGGRYITLFTFIGLLISLDVTTEINCQALYQFLVISGQMMIAFASMNLAIRTMAIWSQAKYIVIPLSLISAGHWGVVLSGTVISAQWVPGQGCVATQTKNSQLMLTFIYSLCFDTIVFLLSAWKLAMPKHHRSQLVDLMFKDGLGYFLLVSILNIPAAVFAALKLNPVMDITFNLPAAALSNILACRAVRRLANFSTASPAVYMTTTQKVGTHDVASTGNISFAKNRSQGVHVQMDTFTMGEDGSHGTDYSQSKADPESFVDMKKPHAY